MRFREIFRYELEYRLRSASTWIYAVILLVLPFWMMHATYDSATIHFNAPVRLASGMIIVGMVGMLVSAALFGDAAMRDVEVEMDPLLYTTPISSFEYLGGRFTGALVVNWLIAIAIPVGLWIAGQVPFLDESQVGPFRIAAYVQPYLMFTLPNVLLTGAILFTIAVLARRTVPVYLGAVVMFIGYIIAASAWEQVTNPTLSMFSDPYGAGVHESITRYWTPVEQNEQLVGFPTVLLLNRLIWISFAALVLAVLHRTFRFAHREGRDRRRKSSPVDTAARHSEFASIIAAPVVQVFDERARVKQVFAIARQSLEEIALSRSFVVTLIIGMGLTLLFGWNVGSTAFDTSTWPVTHLVASAALTTRIAPVTVLLVAVWAGELVWKDRDAGMAEIVDAAPVREGVLLIGRFIALIVMVAALHVAFMVTGILIQALQGYYDFEPGLYLSILFGLNLPRYTLIAALAVAIHVTVNRKYIGHFVVMIAWGLTITASVFGIGHNLLIYANTPGWTYSDMNGFGPFLAPYIWFTLYWAAWALLLGVAANLLLVRGREERRWHRIRTARTRFVGPVVRTAGVAILLVVVFGGFIFYNTNVLNEYVPAKEAGTRQAMYEQRFARFEDTPQPMITDVTMHVEIHPDDRLVDLRGTYRMVNRTDASIDAIHVTLIEPYTRVRSISFDRAAETAIVDDETGFRVYALEQPVEPGERIELTFDVAYQPRGFRNRSIPTDVVSNGTYINRRWLPAIGYQPSFELSDSEDRQRFGLEPQPPVPGPDDVDSAGPRWTVRNEDLVNVDAVIGTAEDQIALTYGALRRSWTENGRRYFHYRSETPIPFGSVFSARYAEVEDRWNDVELRIFHHPGHSDNLDRVMDGVKTTLEYATREFGPYPYSHMRVVEIPPYSIFGRAFPGMMAFSEAAFISRVGEGQIDQPFYGTAHEVAHTWWGGLIRGAPVRGYGMLTESLANYTAMMVLEKAYGRDAARRVYDFQMDRYMAGRATQSREVPALDVTDQPYIAYRKGAIALYTMREFIGEEAINTALRKFVDRFRDQGPPYPTSRDLYAELRAVTPDSLHTLLADLFERVTIWDVRTQNATMKVSPASGYTVTLEVTARKLVADSIGHTTEVPMDDLVEIGVFANAEDGSIGAPLYLKQHRITSGSHTIRIHVDTAPSRAAIDPYNKLIDPLRNNNVKQVTASTD